MVSPLKVQIYLFYAVANTDSFERINHTFCDKRLDGKQVAEYC